MRTHDIASVLTELARALRAAPDQDLADFLALKRERRNISPENIPLALSTLVALSDVDKSQWMNFIRQHNFDIPFRPRDASRDILGKLLKYLEQNPEARRRITTAAQKGRTETSPELQKALEFLLRT